MLLQSCCFRPLFSSSFIVHLRGRTIEISFSSRERLHPPQVIISDQIVLSLAYLYLIFFVLFLFFGFQSYFFYFILIYFYFYFCKITCKHTNTIHIYKSKTINKQYLNSFLHFHNLSASIVNFS